MNQLLILAMVAVIALGAIVVIIILPQEYVGDAKPQDGQQAEKVYTPQEVWDNQASLQGQEIKIRGDVVELDEACTMMACLDDPCCNRCSGWLGYEISSDEKLHFKGEYLGEDVRCQGDTCVQECYPFEPSEYLVDAIVVRDQTYDTYYLELVGFEEA